MFLKILSNASFFTTISILSCFGAESNIQIDYMMPPSLDEIYLGRRIIGYRPMREEKPRIEYEESNTKHIFHNYGHGGSGWTLLFGSVNESIKQLEETTKQKRLTMDTPITVVGAGCMGLTTAVELSLRGHKNIFLIAENFKQTTSHDAGGLLAPVSMSNEKDFQRFIDQIGIDAFLEYSKIINGTHQYLEKGAVKIPTYFRNRKESGLEPYVGICMEPAKNVVLDFQNGKKQPMVRYESIFMDTAVLMESLLAEVKKRGITTIEKKVDSFEEIETKVVFNCTGLGSAKLSCDKNMISVQGHLVMLKNQEKPKDSTLSVYDSMILTYGEESTTSKGFPITRSFYQFPKKDIGSLPNDVGLIGGTFVKGADSRYPHEEEFNNIIRMAKEFYGVSHFRPGFL